MYEDVRDFLKEHNLVHTQIIFKYNITVRFIIMCSRPVRSYIMYVHSNAIQYRAICIMN